MTAGYGDKRETRWWIEPVNAGSIDTSYLGVKPVNEAIQDAEGWYWTSICCDFPFELPLDGGIEGAYTIREVKMGIDSLYYAEPVKLFAQGEIVTAATPVLLKCKAAYASGNKIIPVGEIANHRTMPIVNDLLMGNYFSSFYNHDSFIDTTSVMEYVPKQATLTSPENLALGVDADGKLGFFPQLVEDSEATYMAANSAWLSVDLMGDELQGVTAIYLGEAPVAEPEPEIEKGDVNGDGQVSIRDVTSLIELLLSGEAEDGSKTLKKEYEAADMNNDGKLTIKDVTLLIEVLLTMDNDEVQE